MCLKFSKGDGTYYARLCYKTGQAGVHRDLTADQATNWEWGMFHGEGRRRGSSRKRVFVTFDVSAAPEAVADMARYIGTNRYTRDPITGHVSFYAERGLAQGDFRRAESFGWRVVEQPAASVAPALSVEPETKYEYHPRDVEMSPEAVEQRRQMVEEWLKNIADGKWRK